MDADRVAPRRGLRRAARRRKLHVVAFDYGVKKNILRMLAERGCQVTVVPAQTPAAEVLKLKPDGIFLSNGPGDPEPCDYAIDATRELIEARHPDLRHLPGPPDHGARLRREDVQDEVRPPRREPPGEGPRHAAASRSPARTTASRSTRRRCRPTCAPRTCRCSTARCKASRAPTSPRSASRATRKRRPGPHDIGYLFDRFVEPDGRAHDEEAHAEAHRHQERSSSSAPARSSSARPASSTTPACRPARRCARRATRSSWSTSNPATIMTDPETADVDLHRADHLADGREDHRQGAARRDPADDGRPDRAQLRARPARATACSTKYERRDDRRQREGDRQGRGPPEVQGRDDEHRPRLRRARASRTRWKRRWRCRSASAETAARLPDGDPPELHAGRHRRRHRLQPGRVRGDLQARPRRSRRPTSC